MIDYESICRKTISVAVEAGHLIKNERAKFRKDAVEKKGLHDFVSYVDRASEELIVKELKGLIPEAGFIAEEGTVAAENKHYRWVIDPLDGTTNFIHGISPFAVSIALMEGEEVVVGVVYEVSLDECFYAWKGGNAYLNGTPIEVSTAPSIHDSLVATGFPYYDFSKTPEYLKFLEYLMRNTHGIRRLGSAATDLAYVAAGRFDAFYEYSLQSYDVAAGSLIVKQAGGHVCDFSGGNNYIFGKEIVACNTMLKEEFTGIVKSHLKEFTKK
ncbi:inositol monophosphatase family protein [Acetobacteroides hydrogenigenes]|uniref:Inositol-1-monophosphatase n=1 Tax=Acetobacteroides hydrogenigenes TaxID=979970 RepID=A0A4V2RQ38_9BACT|nr:inositol monophosphatase family protein [Acetobacteroides hydrogenigenes]TCN70080.1 myo-inositol-1(or 4)-monophosphatase [Acetobacteroides hydrogenigenes]